MFFIGHPTTTTTKKKSQQQQYYKVDDKFSFSLNAMKEI